MTAVPPGMPRRRLSHDAYRVGWICPLEVEQIAAMEMLDEEHERLPQLSVDTNIYTLGSINNHNVVIAGLPQAGNCYAATVITQMRMTFPSLKYGLLVGIGGGVPVKTDHGMIRLGHVVVSEPTGVHSGAVQYDHGKARSGYFERKGFLAPPPTVLLNAAREVAIRRQRIQYDPVWENTQRIQTTRRHLRRFRYPGTTHDHLYRPDYKHQQEGVSCEEGGCDPTQRIERPLDEDDGLFVVVHRGTIASGELVIKDAITRDNLAHEHGVLCFEMEAVGALADFPCMVIRGISDYCDSHKNDMWHGYAAAVAAAYARQLFFHISIEEEAQRRSVQPLPSGGTKAMTYTTELQTESEPNAIEHQSRTYYVIPSLANRHFTGRESTLEKLQQMLFVQASSQKLALFGLGGVGKTQVALQFTHWVKTHTPECSIFWAPALSLESFEQACSQIVKKLNTQRSDNESAMELVREHLSSPAAGRWLFIVDNADDYDLLFDELEPYFPTSDNGAILLTTRSREVAVSFAEKDTIELQNMTAGEATSFLAKIAREDLLSDRASTAQLLEELHCLPLAITQAGFYINRNNVSTTRYLAIMHSTEKDRMNLLKRDFHDSTRYLKLPNAVATAWLISFDMIRNSDPAAAELLEFISCIEPKAIPRSILPPLESEEKMEFALGTLCGYAFLTKREDGDMFDVHSLVQLSMRLWTEKEGHTFLIIKKTLQHMEEVFPSVEYTNREIWRAYLPHALQILQRDEDKGMSERYSLLSNVADCFLEDGRAREAVVYSEEVSAWNETNYNEEHPDRLMSQHELAKAYQANGQIKQAIDLFEHVVAVRQRTLSEEDANRLSSQHELAIAYEANGQIKQAVGLLEHVVAVRQRTLSEEHPNRLASQHTLAMAYRVDGQIKQAIDLLEHVVAVEERKLDEEHPDRLASQHALAIAYEANGQIKQAVDLLEHVVAVRQRTLSEEHPNRLASQHVLAIAYRADGQIKQAIDLLEHVVAVKERTLNEEHPDRLASQHALAIAYKANGQTKQAIDLLEHVVAVEERTLNEEHPSRLASQHELAIAYEANGQIKQAIDLLEHVVIYKRTLSEEHPSRLASQHALAIAYKANGQTKLAIDLLEHVVIYKRTLSEEHPSRLASQHALAIAYKANGQTKQAIDLLEHVVAVEERTLNEEHPDRLASLQALADIKQSYQL
ncbi:uncharacterized protein N7482_005173 [Penicillium canariense]|uniref:NB-ARC domain-containing protein n=1 Tax=Penicillium canariense TaxID=189055 RepID=A0A9W9LMC1_9EURO|nr:uncharacterized protein N7482_005173 [Penicillium canariense]KAJ5166392.1 hypothetical protein N7482_005173 [Penicillium canariense]